MAIKDKFRHIKNAKEMEEAARKAKEIVKEKAAKAKLKKQKKLAKEAEEKRKEEEKAEKEKQKAIFKEYVAVENEARAKCMKAIKDDEWNSMTMENPKNKKYVNEWLRDIVKPSKSPMTYKQYKSAIRQFIVWNENENEGQGLHRFKKRSFIRYQNFLLEQGLSKKSIEFKRNVVSSFCNYIEVYISEEDDSYETFKNFVKGTEPPTGKEKVYEKIPITFAEFEKVKDWLLNNKKYMLNAIWTTLFYTGNRISEVLQLKLSDVKDIPDGTRFIKTGDIRGKGKGIQGS